MSIITSLLDTDLYKLTMQQCVLHNFPDAVVTYNFVCRNPSTDLNLADYITEIQEEIAALCALKFTQEDLEYLASLNLFTPDYLQFLRGFNLDISNIHLSVDTQGCKLALTINGSWVDTILFEIPILAIINEIYFKHLSLHSEHQGMARLQTKLALLTGQKTGFKFTDFGTRRRFAKSWQQTVIETILQQVPDNFVGTSNISLAKKFGLKPIGTMAHEYLQACQQLAPSLMESQQFALNLWLQEYAGKLGIALTDVITTDVFLRDFSKDLAEQYAGVRHDSGSAIEWGEKVLQHYSKLGINGKDKVLVFSDGLNMQRALEIYNYFKGRAQLLFGIGTNLTNDVGYETLQIVIKLVRCNNKPVAKITDDSGKVTALDLTYLQKLKQTFQVK